MEERGESISSLWQYTDLLEIYIYISLIFAVFV